MAAIIGQYTNVSPRPADSNELINAKPNLYLRCKDYVYFEPVHPWAIDQALDYLKSHNKFHKDITI